MQQDTSRLQYQERQYLEQQSKPAIQNMDDHKITRVR